MATLCMPLTLWQLCWSPPVLLFVLETLLEASSVLLWIDIVTVLSPTLALLLPLTIFVFSTIQESQH